MEILDGKALSAKTKEEIRQKGTEEFLSKGKNPPCLACIIVGDNPASQTYVASKEKACNAVGFGSIIKRLPESSTKYDVIFEIEKLNEDPTVSAILLQLPLPDSLKEYEDEIINHISPEKDADGLTYVSLGKLMSGKSDIAPCTAKGIIELLDEYNIDIAGKNAVVMGRSLLVGKSVANLLEQRNATVTICHSKTKDLEFYTKHADILVVAIGKEKYVKAEMVKDGAIVVDVGINRIEGKIVGDVDFENVCEKCSYITPVPGGVGPMTIATLLTNTYKLAVLQEEKNKDSDLEQIYEKDLFELVNYQNDSIDL